MTSLKIAFAVAACLLVVADAHQEDEGWWPSAEFAVIQKVYDDCSTQPEITACLKSKALNALSRAVDQENIQLTDGLVLVKQNDSDYQGPAEARDFSGLSGEDKLDAQLKSKFQQLVNTHTLTMDLASEGRGSASWRNNTLKSVESILFLQERRYSHTSSSEPSPP
jgi:hypothetical protein